MIAALVVDGSAPIDNLVEYEPWVVVVPDGEPARKFDFRFLAGLWVVICAATLERVVEIAAQMDRFWPLQMFMFADEIGVLMPVGVREL
jgi:hypothetical protein